MRRSCGQTRHGDTERKAKERDMDGTHSPPTEALDALNRRGVVIVV
jgi:hypothetical protein